MALLHGILVKVSCLLIICSCLITSCRSADDYITATDYWATGDSVVLNTEENILYLSLCQSFSEIDGKEYLFYGNVLASNSIFVFDLESGDCVRAINLSTDGPNSVGNNSYGFYAHNFDSIFVLSQTERVISLIDTTGTISFRYQIPPSDKYSLSTYLVTTMNAISFEQNILDIPNFSVIPPEGNMYSRTTTLFSLDLEDEVYRRDLYYPEIYDKGYWREPSFLQVNRTKNLDSGHYVTGYGIDHFLRLGSEKFEARSVFLSDFEPIDDKYDPNKTYAKALVSVFKQGYYASLITDHHNRRYLRLVVHPISSQDYAQGVRTFDFSIILLDQHLTIVDEKLLPANLDAFKFFMRKGKLYMADKRAYEKNEDKIVFREIIFDL